MSPATVAEVGHLLAAVALALGFLVLTRRHLHTMATVAAGQSAVVALAAAWRAASGSAGLWGMALVVVIGGVVALPLLWRTQANAATATPRAPAAVTVAAALVVLAILAVLPAHLPSTMPLREDLALALSAVLVALLVPPTRREAPAQLVGLHALANGTALVAVVAGAPPTAAVAVLVLYGFVAAGLGARVTA